MNHDMQRNIKNLSEGGLFHNAYTIENGIVRWDSNNRVPPSDMVESMIAYGHDNIDVAACDAVREEEDLIAVQQYIEARNNMTDEQRAEEAFERRAAFGEGVEVVNVLSGERFVS